MAMVRCMARDMADVTDTSTNMARKAVTDMVKAKDTDAIATKRDRVRCTALVMGLVTAEDRIRHSAEKEFWK